MMLVVGVIILRFEWFLVALCVLGEEREGLTDHTRLLR